MKRLVASCLLVALGSLPALARAPSPRPIVELQAKPKPTVFQDATATRPLLLRSQAELEATFEEPTAKPLRAIDFSTQEVLVFAWRGSGKDKLSYVILESAPPQVHFSYQRGLTKDLRPHIKVFALRKNVRWKTQDTSSEAVRSAGRIVIDAQGILRPTPSPSQSVEPRYELLAGGGTLRLELPPKLRARASHLLARAVRVRGSLTWESAGPQTGWVVTVTALGPTDNGPKQKPRPAGLPRLRGRAHPK